MKIQKFVLLALSLVLVLGISSCKKYDENDGMTVRTVKKRLVGEWEASITMVLDDILGDLSALLGGGDLGGLLGGDTTTSSESEAIEIKFIYIFEKKGDLTVRTKLPDQELDFFGTVIPIPGTTTSNEGTWEFGDKKETIITTVTDADDVTTISELTINKLTMKELKLTFPNADLGFESLEFTKKDD